MRSYIFKRRVFEEDGSIYDIFERRDYGIVQDLIKIILEDRESERNRLKSQDKGQRGEIPSDKQVIKLLSFNIISNVMRAYHSRTKIFK